jgi:hypothetical protein
MSAQANPARDRSEKDVRQEEDWVRIPAVIDPAGDRIVTLFDERGRPQARLVAEVVLEAFAGPRPPGHVILFKNGDRLNCDLANLEWIPCPNLERDVVARARAIATRERADATRRSLEGRPHSDSGELLAEDRLR